MRSLLSPHDIRLVFPLVVVAAFVLLSFISRLWKPHGKISSDAFTATSAVFTAAFITLRQVDISAVAFNGAFIADNYARAYYFLFIFVTLIAILIDAGRRKSTSDEQQTGGFIFFITALLGMMLTASAGNLLLIFAGIEISAISGSALSGLRMNGINYRAWKQSYYLSVFLLVLGAAVVYLTTGTCDLFGINEHFIVETEGSRTTLLGFFLTLPWLLMSLPPISISLREPDAYKRMPASVVLFLSVGPAAAAFAAIFRVMHIALPHLSGQWTGHAASAAVMLMTAGNILVMLQTDVKKMIAYSGMTTAGYALVASVAGGVFGNVSLVFFWYANALGLAGAFALMGMLEKPGTSEIRIADIAGLERKHYIFAAIMSLFLFSLAGMPLTAGFTGLFRIIVAAVKANMVLLALITAINAAVAFLAMIRLIVLMFIYEPREEVRVRLPGAFEAFAILICIQAVILLGMFPSIIRRILMLLQHCVIYFD